MELKDQDKEIEMPATMGYNPPNRDSSSKLLSSPTVGESDPPAQTHTTFSNLPQTSDHHHLHFAPPSPPPPPLPSNQLQQSPRPRSDLDPSSSPVATTSTPIVTGSNPRAAASSTILTPLIRYRECLKNHAASMGSHVVDGCGEFMPSGEEGTLDSLRCAACECHRNFHRKETEGEPPHVSNYSSYYPNKSNGQHRIPSPQFPTLPPSSHHQYHRFSHGLPTPTAGVIPSMMLAFGSGAGVPVESSSEDLNIGGQPSLSKKRFRTKFTQQQKDRMMEFADKLGWKIQKHDEQEVQQFCSQVGVKRQVFKVWMHNNKQARKEAAPNVSLDP